MKIKPFTAKPRAAALKGVQEGLEWGSSRMGADDQGNVWARTTRGLGASAGAELDVRMSGEGYLSPDVVFGSEIMTNALALAETVHSRQETGRLGVTAAFKKGRERVDARPIDDKGALALAELVRVEPDALAAWGPGALDLLVKVARECRCGDGFAVHVTRGGWRASTACDGAMSFDLALDPPEHLELGEAGREGGFGEAELCFNVSAAHAEAFMAAVCAGGGGVELWSGAPSAEAARREREREEMAAREAARKGVLQNPFLRSIPSLEDRMPAPLKLDIVGRRVARAMICGWRGLDGCCEGRMVNPPSHLSCNVGVWQETLWRVWQESEELDRRRIGTVQTHQLAWAAASLRELVAYWRGIKDGDKGAARVKVGGDKDALWFEIAGDPAYAEGAPFKRITLDGDFVGGATHDRPLYLDARYLSSVLDGLLLGACGPLVDLYTVGPLHAPSAEQLYLARGTCWRSPVHFEPRIGKVRAVLMPTMS